MSQNSRILEAASTEVAMRTRRISGPFRPVEPPALDYGFKPHASNLKPLAGVHHQDELATRSRRAETWLESSLLSMGFDTGIAGLLSQRTLKDASIAELGQPARLAARAIETLRQMVRLQPGLQPGRKGPRVFALVGPPGTGKTTTAAKLAALYAPRCANRVAIISIRNGRAAEQKSPIEGVGNLPLCHLSEPAEAQNARERLSSTEIVIADAPGCAHLDIPGRSQTARLLAALAVDEVFLLVEAGILAERAGCIASSFATLFNISRIIVTKLDELPYIGAAISIAWRLKRPIAYLTTGPGVPGNIRAAGFNSISRLLAASFEKAIRSSER